MTIAVATFIAIAEIKVAGSMPFYTKFCGKSKVTSSTCRWSLDVFSGFLRRKARATLPLSRSRPRQIPDRSQAGKKRLPVR
jgi:hypothetical protein